MVIFRNIILFAHISLTFATLSIPYDPTLVLGNVITIDKINTLIKLSELQTQVNALDDAVTSAFQLVLSIKMSIVELGNLQIDTSNLRASQISAEDDLKAYIAQRTAAKISYQKAVLEESLKVKASQVGKEPNSPLNFEKSKLQYLDLSSDTMKMDVQYYKFMRNSQSNSDEVATISSSIAESISFLGDYEKASTQSQIHSQVNRAYQNDDMSGMLTVSISSTHKKVAQFSPIIINIDEMMRAYALINGKAFDPKVQRDCSKASDPTMTILTGVSYGSSFIGFIYITNDQATSSNQITESSFESANAAVKISSWFDLGSTETSGQVTSQASSMVKNLLSTQNVNSHFGVICLGIIPTIASNNLKTALKGYDMGATAEQAINAFNDVGQNGASMANAVQESTTKNEFIKMVAEQAKSTFVGLAALDEEENKVLDLNSMMNAIDDYVTEVRQAQGGVPINFFIESYTDCDIQRMWQDKYDKYSTRPKDSSSDTSN